MAGGPRIATEPRPRRAGTDRPRKRRHLDAIYLIVDEVGGGRLPRARSRRSNAERLGGESLPLARRPVRPPSGRPPETSSSAPTTAEHRRALDRESSTSSGTSTRRCSRPLRGDLRHLERQPDPSNPGHRQPGDLEAIRRGLGTRQPSRTLARGDPRGRSVVRRQRDRRRRRDPARRDAAVRRDGPRKAADDEPTSAWAAALVVSTRWLVGAHW